MRRRGERGFGLIILITLIAVCAIFISGTTVYVTNSARQIQLKTDATKAEALSQAGVMQALHNWRVSNPVDTARTYAELDTTLFGAQGYKTGTSSDFAYFMFNSPSNSGWSSTSRYRAWTIRNIHSSAGSSPLRNITLTRARVTWSPVGGRLLNDIRLNGHSVLGSNTASGTEVALTNTAARRTLAPGNSFSGNNTYLNWNGAMPANVRVTVQWTFSDDSSTMHSRSSELVYWDGAQAPSGTATAARPSQRTFSIVSTGRVAETAGLPAILTTAKATVSGAASGGFMEVVDWDRVEKNLI